MNSKPSNAERLFVELNIKLDTLMPSAVPNIKQDRTSLPKNETIPAEQCEGSVGQLGR
jgi:hypothetical protein